MARGSFLHRALIAGITGIFFAGPAFAAHLDPAPISDEVAQGVLGNLGGGQGNPLPEALRHHLDETTELIKQVDENERGDASPAEKQARFDAKRMLFASKVQELELVRAEIRTQFAQTRSKLVSLGLPEKVKALDDSLAKVEQRFERVKRMLGGIHQSAKSERGRMLAEAKAMLQDLHGKIKDREASPSAEPVPTFGMMQPTTIRPQKTQQDNVAPPQFLSKKPRVPNNLYAFVGNTLLAALPDPTPAEASVCNYTAADLAQNQEIQFTQDIKDLAARLGYSPAKIYQYVQNNIKFEPYWGSLKGAQGTLISKAGNSTDQTSLLIALLRASNIPARYVQGTMDFENDDPRALRWLGVKSFAAAQAVLRGGYIPSSYDATYHYMILYHVLAEACVPYGNYRGSGVDKTGHRWIPLDASFKDITYQAGIATNVDFDYTNYMVARTDRLPYEKYEDQVESYIKGSGIAPNGANNTLEDVGYTGTPVIHSVDILPASLPYLITFQPWTASSTSSETAEVPDTHRYKLAVTVKNSSNSQLLTTTLSYPQQALQRLTLSYLPYSASDQTIWNSWNGDLKSLPAGVVNIKPVIKVEGTDQAVGTIATPLGQNNYLTLKLTLGEYNGLGVCVADSGTGYDTDTTCVNKTVYDNIKAGGYHALQAYAFQASDQLLMQRAAKLLASVRASPAPTAGTPYLNDDTTGEFLHVALSKYMRYYTDAARRISELDGAYGKPGNHLGLTSSDLKVQYLFDVPYAVFPGALLIDVKSALYMPIDQSTGSYKWKTFKLLNYNGSAFEHYIWQETARLDAVSTVRGLQYAKETSIPIITLSSSNIASYDSLMDPSMASYKTAITNYANQGYVITVPKRTISYVGQNQPQPWNGAVFMAENQSANKISAIISGSLGGGYAFFNPPPINYFSYLNPVDPFANIGYYLPTPVLPSVTTIPPMISSAVGLGITPYITTAGDPVNMVTGNMYHTERDITLKGRGGLPIVFERSYNSRDAKDSPLGYGWTHSLNHYLIFKDDNVNGATDAADTDATTSSVSWIDGTGSEKQVQVAGNASGVAIGGTFTAPKGFFFQTTRNADGTYSIREKNGLTYTFENIAGTVNQKAKLSSIKDRNGNTLTLNYTGSNLTTVTDSLNRTVLTFTYDGNNHITQIADVGGRLYQYGYTDGNSNLNTFKNPLAVAGTQNPVGYVYYSAADGANLNHAMKSYALPRGNGMTFEYYMNGKVFKHYTTAGDTNTFTYNDFRRETVQVNERGFTRKFFFDAYGNPLRIVEENGAERLYTYDPANPYNRLSKRDPEGYITSYVYDASGNITQVTNPSNSTVVSSNYNAFNQPGKVKDARGNYTLYKYDANGNVLQEIKLNSGIGAALDPATYTPAAADLVAWAISTYDANGNLLSSKKVRDFVAQTGPTIENTYDAQGLNAITLTRRGDKDGDGVIAANEYDSASMTYDAFGRLKTGIDNDWHSTQFQYDAADRVIRATDALGNLRDNQFDTNGNALGNSLTVTINSVPTLIDSSSASYDQSDRKERSLDTAGNTTAYQYDAAGNVIKITNPDNYSLAFDYDANNHVIKAYDQENHAVSRTLDLSGKPRSITDPNGNTVKYEYYDSTKDGRLKKQTDALLHVTTFDYDVNGNTTSVTDNLGRTTLTQYDALNRPVRIVGPSYTDATYGLIRPVTKYTYDNLGNLTQVSAGRTDSSGTNIATDITTPQTTVAFDDFGRKLKETDPLGKFWAYTYDKNNNVTKVTNAKNQITQYTWGYGHQLLARTDATNNMTGYARNALGQVLVAQSPSVTYRYAYDAAHRLQSVTDSRGNKTLSYTYSPGGLLNKMLDSDNNETDYLYDPVGRLAGIWAPNLDYISFNYDAGGRLIEKWFPNGINTQYTWNADNTLKQVKNRLAYSDANLISQHDYTYDTVGNRQTHTEKVGGTTTPYKYIYDELNRLTEVRNNSTSALIESTTFDVLNNRIAKSDGINVTAYVYDAANQLKEIRQTNAAGALLAGLVYDANGSLVAKCQDGTVTRSDTACTGTTTTSLTYDAMNRVSQVAKTGLSNQTYAYDDQDRRISKTIGTASTNFLYNGPDIHGEYTTWTAANAIYTHGPNTDDPIIRQGATTQYFHQDGLGSVVALTNSTGGTDGSQRFDAWGNKLASTGSIPQYGYTGREPDETGLVYYRARYYDSSIGRFISRDPIGLEGGINQYAYVNGNPVNFNDPEGLFITNLIGGAFNAAVGIGVNAYLGERDPIKLITNAGVDFGVGFASSGVAGLGKVYKFLQATNTFSGKFISAASGEVFKGAVIGDDKPIAYGTTAAIAGTINATGVIGKAATEIGSMIPGVKNALYQADPKVAALFQKTSAAPGIRATATEGLGLLGNVPANLGMEYLKAGLNSQSSNTQSLPTITSSTPSLAPYSGGGIGGCRKKCF